MDKLSSWSVKVIVLFLFSFLLTGDRSNRLNLTDKVHAQNLLTPYITPTPVPDWYDSKGNICNSTNFIGYYSGPDCSGQVGYRTEGISPSTPCDSDGIGYCYRASGKTVNHGVQSIWKRDTTSCSNTSGSSTSPMYETIEGCGFRNNPPGSIDGTVTVNFTDPNQFNSVFVWVQDTTSGQARSNYEIEKSKIVTGLPNKYVFEGLNTGKVYELTAKAYGTELLLDYQGIAYGSACERATCYVKPTGTADFTITFPKPTGPVSLDDQTTNEAFKTAFDKWQKGEITALEISAFIQNMTRVPGLQKAICEPKIPGGCRYPTLP